MDYPKPEPLLLRKKLGWFLLLYASGFFTVLAMAMIFHVLVLDAVH